MTTPIVERSTSFVGFGQPGLWRLCAALIVAFAVGHADRADTGDPPTRRSHLPDSPSRSGHGVAAAGDDHFRVGPRSAVFLVFLGAFYPMLVNTIFGVRSVEPRLFEAAAMLGCRGSAQFFRVVLPAALPSIFTGMRLGLGFAWVVIVVGEMTGVPTGLGAIIMEAREALAHRDRDFRNDRDRACSAFCPTN